MNLSTASIRCHTTHKHTQLQPNWHWPLGSEWRGSVGVFLKAIIQSEAKRDELVTRASRMPLPLQRKRMAKPHVYVSLNVNTAATAVQ